MRRVLITICTVILVAQANVALADQWTQLGFDAQGSGINPTESVIDTTNASHWRTSWQHRANERRTYLTNPVVTDDAVYVAGDKIGKDGLAHLQVWSYAADSGTLSWSTHLPCDGVEGGLELGDGMLVVLGHGCPKRNGGIVDAMILLDPARGAQLSLIQLPGRSVTATVSGHLAIVFNGHQVFSVVDLRRREVIRSVAAKEGLQAPAPMPVVDGVAYLSYGYGPQAFSDDAMVMMGHGTTAIGVTGGARSWGAGCDGPDDNDVICAVDRTDGRTLWTKPLTSLSPPAQIFDYNAPIVVGETVYSAGDGSVHALDLRTGDPIWDTPVPIDSTRQAGDITWRPIYANGVVYVIGYDPVRASTIVIGLDATTGQIVTQRPGTGLMGPLGGRFMAVVNGRLVTSGPDLRVTSFDRP